ncbi:MAG: transglycosylase domain-containing protein [Clostridia bacterium]|nr:transglycosylase domain-containing protein [Clostridia bacterium]
MRDNDFFGRDNVNEPDLNSNNSDDNIDLSSTDSETFDLNSFSFSESQNVEEVESSENDSETEKKKGFKFTKATVIKTVLTSFLILVITGCLVAGSFLIYVFAFVDGTMQEDLNNLALNYTTTIYVEEGDQWVEYQRLHGDNNRIWVDYDKTLAQKKDAEYDGIPYNLAMAFVAIEDRRFADHDGVDWKRTFGAFLDLVFADSNYGGSTITQQLVKNLTDDKERDASRKIREIMRARYLEGKYTKEVILECYMNTIAMGNGIYGVEVAAEYYFGKQVSELTIAECASLAGITKSPENYRPDTRPEKNKERRNTVLYEMYDQGYITKAEYDEAVATPIEVVADKKILKEKEINSYFVDTLYEDVVNELMRIYNFDRSHAEKNFYNGGYKIYSTLDPKVQAAVEKVFTDDKYALKGKDGQTLQGSITVMDYSGNVLGISGGIGEKTENRGLNRAIMSPRQPGSTMKPIAAYAPAIERDLITYSSIVNDKRIKYGNWTPNNWYGGYKGNITVKYALEKSVNTIPVYLVDKLSINDSFDFLTKTLGITTLNEEDRNYSPLGMGGTNGGITTRESAAAYAIFGNGGRYYEPKTFVRIYDQQGELISSKESTPRVALGEDSATVMNKLLQNVVYGPEGTGRGAGSYVAGSELFAKTGTSNNSNDLWFVGGTPYYIASCWAGYDQPQNITRSNIALTMWGAVMSEVHRGLEKKSFEVSDYVKCRLYCKETGLIATDKCPTGSYGWYKTSNMKVCEKHVGTEIPADSQNEINDYLGNNSSVDGSNSSASSTTSSQTSSATSSAQSSSGNQSSTEITSSNTVTSTEQSSSQPELGEGEPVTEPISEITDTN